MAPSTGAPGPLEPAAAEPPRWWRRTGPITLTVVTAISADEVAVRLGVDAHAGEPVLLHDVWDGREYDAVHLAVQIDEFHPRVVIVEPNGWLMSDDARAERVSQGGSLVSLYWSENMDMRFIVAADGEVVRSFDPLLYHHPSIGEPLAQERDLPFGAPGSLAAAILLQQRLTGIEMTAEWLVERPHPTWWGIPA